MSHDTIFRSLSLNKGISGGNQGLLSSSLTVYLSHPPQNPKLTSISSEFLLQALSPLVYFGFGYMVAPKWTIGHHYLAKKQEIWIKVNSSSDFPFNPIAR